MDSGLSVVGVMRVVGGSVVTEGKTKEERGNARKEVWCWCQWKAFSVSLMQ